MRTGAVSWEVSQREGRVITVSSPMEGPGVLHTHYHSCFASLGSGAPLILPSLPSSGNNSIRLYMNLLFLVLCDHPSLPQSLPASSEVPLPRASSWLCLGHLTEKPVSDFQMCLSTGGSL